jgi:ferric-dicitrate binding protein FerR (iron transport regulator)
MIDPTLPDSLDDYRFAAYLGDAMSPVERAEFLARLDADPAYAERFRQAQAAWAAGRAPMVAVDVPGAWARVRAAVGLAPPTSVAAVDRRPPRPRIGRGTPRRRNLPWIGAVVVALLVLAGGAVWFQRADTSVRPERIYQTAAGQRATVTLPDGSQIILAPRTRLAVDAGFGANARSVAVRGQAYFTVAPSSHAPFLVRTGTVTTRVLGTAFDVKQYADDPSVQVIVRTGKVVIQGPRTALLLTAGMMGRMTDSGGVASMVSDTDAYAGWTTGGLRFVNVPVPEMLRELGQWYGITFKLNDTTLARREVTITYDRVTAEQAISMLEQLLSVTASYENVSAAAADGPSRIVTLRPGNGTASRRDTTHPVLSPQHEVGK